MGSGERWPPPDLKGLSLVLDGHNRIEIASEQQLEHEYDVIQGIESREQATSWIINNQLGRRKLTPDQASHLRGLLYIRAQGNAPSNRKSCRSASVRT